MKIIVPRCLCLPYAYMRKNLLSECIFSAFIRQIESFVWSCWLLCYLSISVVLKLIFCSSQAAVDSDDEVPAKPVVKKEEKAPKAPKVVC